MDENDINKKEEHEHLTMKQVSAIAEALHEAMGKYNEYKKQSPMWQEIERRKREENNK